MPKQMTSGKLIVKIYPSRKEMGAGAAVEAAAAIRQVIESKGSCNIIFAAAPSQNEFLASLIQQEINWNLCNAFHMDEYIGLSPEAPQGFGNFLKRAIFDKVPFQNIYLISDYGSSTTAAEKYSELLKENPPDVVCMGIGENGHIAFNDPHVAHFDDAELIKVVELDEKCRLQQVNDGCFASLSEVPTHALTLTIPVLTSVKHLFCMVPGELKAEAVKATVTGEIREMLPASILRIHNNATLYLDIDSAKHIL